jgi:hypothetical protein
MKNFVLFFLIGASLLIGKETSFQLLPQTAEKLPITEKKHSFFYANSGKYYAGPDMQGIDFGIGYRNVVKYSGFDINIGGTWVDPVLPFIQGSYLFYPLEESGPYTGLGMSIVPYTGWGPIVNFPLIVGYQTSNKNHPVFTQFQFSMFTIPGGTVSLGVGF